MEWNKNISYLTEYTVILKSDEYVDDDENDKEQDVTPEGDVTSGNLPDEIGFQMECQAKGDHPGRHAPDPYFLPPAEIAHVGHIVFGQPHPPG